MSGFSTGSAGDRLARLERELAALEKQIASASPGDETQLLNRAGNLCVDAGQVRRALAYFGRAIDAYLESGRFGAAEVLCRKLLQIAPDTVRARCTLAWLAIGKDSPDAPREIAAYVEAAERAGQRAYAIKQLFMMADARPDPKLLEAITQHLLRLDAAGRPEAIHDMLIRRREAGDAPAATGEGALWSKLLRAALMGPGEIEAHAWAGTGDGGGDLPSLLPDQRP